MRREKRIDLRLVTLRNRSGCCRAGFFIILVLCAFAKVTMASAQAPAAAAIASNRHRPVYPKESPDPQQTDSEQQAAKIFNSYCAACHTIGQGRRLGPDLKGVGTRRSADWLTRWISDPGQLLAEKDATAVAILHEYKIRMPNQHLTSGDVAALVAYLTGSTAAPAPQAAAPVGAGDVTVGRALFTGTVRSRNGGAACIACHSAAGVGILGGGTMGPDLTKVYTKLGSSLIAWPTTMPVMRPIYEAAPLMDREQADLIAFFRSEAAAQPSSPPVAWLIGCVGALAFMMLLGAHLIWRARLRDVRKGLLNRR